MLLNFWDYPATIGATKEQIENYMVHLFWTLEDDIIPFDTWVTKNYKGLKLCN